MIPSETGWVANAITVPSEWLMRAERAVVKVHERLLRTARALAAAKVPYAVIGGNAVAIWVASKDEGAVRNTRDVDILLNRSDLDAAAKAMSAAGFDLTVVNGTTVFLEREDPMPSRGVHVVFANEKVKSSDPYPAPAVKVGLVTAEDVSALDLQELLLLKLLAFRDIDRVHIRDMLHVGVLTQQVIDQVPADLHPRLDEILANPDG